MLYDERMSPKTTFYRLEDDRAIIDQVVRVSLCKMQHEPQFVFPTLTPQEAAALLRMVQKEQSRQYVVLSRHE